MSMPEQITEVGRWFCYATREGIHSLTSPGDERSSNNAPLQGSRERWKTLIFPMALIQLLGLTQGLVQMSGLALMNNAVQKPILEYLIRCLILLVICNPILIWLYGFKNYLFVFDARAWTYLGFVFLDFIAYRLAIAGESFMPRAYNTCLPALVTLMTFFITSILLRVRFNRYHLIALLISCLSLGLIIWGDQAVSLNYFKDIQKKIITGITCTVLSSLVKALSFLTLEAILRQFPILELLSFYGLFGLFTSFLFMVFVDSYEFTSINWSGVTAGYLILSGMSSSLALLLTAKISQKWGTAFSSLADFTSRPWYMGLARLGFSNVPSFPTQFQHGLAYLLVTLSQVLFVYKPAVVVYDSTYKLNFYRRPQS
ncbi:hypothetical protein DSO57_1032805 [Entomophthora muscae]|uniref:Uncharacterized protein n=1 Tax=Entomophthora muscae TaxID=34485 RepID=A0ACC2T0G9_9FUNG|nr:hypothetical protein DSO57_1032805 [Entomophthora muscae]